MAEAERVMEKLILARGLARAALAETADDRSAAAAALLGAFCLLMLDGLPDREERTARLAEIAARQVACFPTDAEL